MEGHSKNSVTFAPADWFLHNYALSNDSTVHQNQSHYVRQQARSLRTSADIRSAWNQYRNTDRLAKRLSELKNWRDLLDFLHDRLNNEIKHSQDAKEVLEKKIASLHNQDADVSRDLTVRHQHGSIDNVGDQVKAELLCYQRLLKSVKDTLQTKLDQVFKQINTLKETRQQVLVDLQDKTVTMEVDREQYYLKEDSPGVSYKPHCMKITKDFVSPEQWLAFSQYNWDRTHAELDSSQQLRDAVHHALHHSDAELDSQREATKLALRNRAHEFQQALNELEWQKKTLADEIAEMENDLDKLEKGIMAKIPMAKLAQTRLERRKQRPGMDLCYDQPHRGLMAEVVQLDATKRALLEKQAHSRQALDALEKQLNRINDDIALKTKGLSIEEKCLQTLDDELPQDFTKIEDTTSRDMKGEVWTRPSKPVMQTGDEIAYILD